MVFSTRAEPIEQISEFFAAQLRDAKIPERRENEPVVSVAFEISKRRLLAAT